MPSDLCAFRPSCHPLGSLAKPLAPPHWDDMQHQALWESRPGELGVARAAHSMAPQSTLP